MAYGRTHGGKGPFRRQGEGYSSEHERIFGDGVDVKLKEASASSRVKKTYVYDAILGRIKLIDP